MKRKIHIDRKPPVDEVIAKHKDFDSLYEKHKSLTKKPRYNALKIITGIILILVVGYLVFDADRSQSNAINPPFNNHQVEPEIHAIDPSQDAHVVLMSGTSFMIPASTIVDGNGNLVKSVVFLRVSEYLNPVDFFLSGIPMNYDSAGTEYTFESAGMMRVEAFSDSGILSLDKGKTIQVSMMTTDSSAYNIYAFDTTDNRWIYNSTDDLVTDSTEIDESSLVISADKMVITRMGNVPDGMSWKEAEERGLVVSDTLCYTDARNTNEYRPVKAREDYSQSLWKARKNAQKEMLRMFKQRDSIATAQRMEMQRQALEQQRTADSLRLAYENQRAKVQKNEKQLVREFEINQFGIWNCDRPLLAEMPDAVEASFAFGGESIKPMRTYYFVQIDLNALYRFYPNESEIECDFNQTHVLWWVGDHQSLFIANPEQFRAAQTPDNPIQVDSMSVEEGLTLLRSTIPSQLP